MKDRKVWREEERRERVWGGGAGCVYSVYVHFCHGIRLLESVKAYFQAIWTRRRGKNFLEKKKESGD